MPRQETKHVSVLTVQFNLSDLTSVRFRGRNSEDRRFRQGLEIGEQNVSIDTLEQICDRLKCGIADIFAPQPTMPNRDPA